MAEKIRVIKKEIGKSAEIVELDDVEKEIKAFVKDPCIEYYPHPKKDVDFIIGLNTQSWDNPATVVLGERDEVLGGNILVVKKGNNMKFISLTEQEAQELLQDIRQRELNDTGINLAMARYDLRQAKRFAKGLAKGIEMDQKGESKMEDSMTVSSGGYKLSVFRDEDAPNPRQWENLGRMVCWHSRYDLGDEHEFEEVTDFLESEEYKNAIVVLPVYMYDHSGLAFSTAPFSDKWDSRQVGFIYVTQEQAKEYFGKEIREEDREGIKELIVSEVKTYDQYFQGDCYAFKISDEFGTVLDEDKGYFGNRISDVLKNMKENVNVEYEGLFGKMEKHSSAYAAMM